MKKHYAIFFGLCALLGLSMLFGIPGTVDAAGHIGFQNVKQYLRTARVKYVVYTPDVGQNTTDVTPGISGVAAAIYFKAGSNTLTQSSTISALPYACKLMVYVKDGDDDAGDALTCTGNITLCGFNQFGQPVNDIAAAGQTGGGCETITTDITENVPVKSERVFERITSVSAATCSGNGTPDTNNKLMVSCAPDIGLPFPISAAGGIIRLCAGEDSDDLQCFSGADIAEDIDLGDDCVKLNGGINSSSGVGDTDDGADITFDDNDVVYLTVRPPAGL